MATAHKGTFSGSLECSLYTGLTLLKNYGTSSPKIGVDQVTISHVFWSMYYHGSFLAIHQNLCLPTGNLKL